jgi:hypothetical protein
VARLKLIPVNNNIQLQGLILGLFLMVLVQFLSSVLAGAGAGPALMLPVGVVKNAEAEAGERVPIKIIYLFLERSL